MTFRQKIVLFLIFIPLAIFLIAHSETKQFSLMEKINAKNINRDAVEDFDIIPLGIEGEVFDMVSDNNNTLHIIWQENDGFHYGKISGDSVVDEETIPDTQSVIIKFQRPRMTVCPDGSSVHLAFIESSPGISLIYCYRDNGGWHTETIWEKHGNYYISVPNVGKDLAGNLHCIAFKWATDADVFKVSYFYKDSGQASWTEIEMLEGDTKYRDNSFFIDYNGGIHATLKCGSGGGYYLYAPSGSHLHEFPMISIPNTGVDSSSIGDIYLDKQNVVHHPCQTIVNREGYKMQYWTKDLDADEFTYEGFIKEDKVRLCHEFESWPAVGVDSLNRVYVSWSEMPCPAILPNHIMLYILEDGVWTENILDKYAEMNIYGRTALAVTAFSVNVLWRSNTGELMLARRITGAAITLNPSDGSNVCGNELDITAEVQGFEDSDPLSKLELFVDDELVTSGTSETLEYSMDISGWELGAEHTIKAIATKISGETVEEEGIVMKDCSPQVTKLTVGSGMGSVESFEMKADATDDIGVERVAFYGANELRGEDETAPYSCDWEITGWRKTNHEVVVKAFDSNGNQSDLDEIPIKFSKISSPANLTIECTPNLTLFTREFVNILKWEAHPKNAGKNVVGYRVYRVEDGEVTDLLADLGPDQFEFVERNLDEGKMYIYQVVTVVNENAELKEGATGIAAVLSQK